MTDNYITKKHTAECMTYFQIVTDFLEECS